MSDTTRVSQVWPTDLKDRVRDRVGNRGLTDFTLAAVQEKLDGGNLGVERDEARLVARRLIDLIANAKDVEDWPQALAERGPWPEWLAEDSTDPQGRADETGEGVGHATDSSNTQAVGDTSIASAAPSPHDERSVEATTERLEEAQAMTLAEIKNTYGLIPASEVAAPTAPEPVAPTCPTCSAPLVDDQCWACSF